VIKEELTAHWGRVDGAWATTDKAKAPTATMIEDFILTRFRYEESLLLDGGMLVVEVSRSFVVSLSWCLEKKAKESKLEEERRF
jgi:hypothetical protein